MTQSLVLNHDKGCVETGLNAVITITLKQYFPHKQKF